MKRPRWFSKWLIIPLLVIQMAAVFTIGAILASLVDTETSNASNVTAWTSTLWTQTSQADFEAGVSTNVSTTSSPGNVRLALTASTLTVTKSPTTNTGSAWTNPANAYGDAGGAATITSGAPSGNNVWGNYGFSSTADAISQVRVRYDAWVAPGMPVFRAAGAKTAGTGAVTVALPAGMAANDICILVATTIAGGSISITADGSISPWTALSGSPIDVTGGEKLYVWWGRFSSGSTGPTVTPGSDHICAGIAAWYGCLDNASPIDVSATGTETTSDTSFSFATGLTTTSNNEMVLVICTSGEDSNTGQFSGAFTNANLSSINTRMNYNTNSGGGGGFGLAEGQLATAGAVGTWAETLATASPKAYISFALKPNYSQIRVDVSWDGGTSWSSKQTTSLTTSETTYWYDVTSATSWTPAKLADGQLQVRVEAYTVGGVAGTVNLDWLPVEVTYYKYASSGTIASQVLDTSVTGSRWDALFWNSTLPASTNITFEVRAQDTSFAKDAGSPSWTSVGASVVPSVLTNSPTTNTGSAWTNPANAYADAGGAATITSGAPSGNNVWGNYGFSSTGAITQVRVRYDAWVAPGMPVFRAAGAKASGTGAVTPALPAGMAANDICILVATTIAGGSISITADGSISPWTALSGSPIDVTGGEKLYVWWGRFSSGSTGPTVTPASDHICAGIAAWYGCLDSGSPIDVSATGTEATSDTSFSFATGLTTTANNEMVLVICTSGEDSNTGQFSGAFTNANLSSINTRMNYNTNSGGGGGFGLAEGQLATAGAVGTWDETLATASPKAYISFALKPNYSQVRVDVSWDGGTSWSSKQTTSLTTSETTYWYDVTSATSWTPAKLADGQLQVRVDAYTAGGAAGTVNLDWLPVEVTFYQYASLSITNGTGRYKQWRATLTPDGSETSTPTLQEVRVYYYGN